MIVKKTGGDFARPETGLQQAVCSHVYDIGIQETTYKGDLKHVHQCIVLWELEERIKEGDYVGKRFVVRKFYTASLSEKANLRKDLVSWRGREFTDQELAGFDLDNIRRANCYLNLVEKKKDNGDAIVVVDAIVPFKKKEGGPVPLVPELPDDYLPDWIKKIMDKAVKEQPMAAQPDTSNIEPNDEIPF
jgi:hypothetical protein